MHFSNCSALTSFNQVRTFIMNYILEGMVDNSLIYLLKSWGVSHINILGDSGRRQFFSLGAGKKGRILVVGIILFYVAEGMLGEYILAIFKEY